AKVIYYIGTAIRANGDLRNNSSFIRSLSSRSFFVSDLIFKVSCIIALFSSFKKATADSKAAALRSHHGYGRNLMVTNDKLAKHS
ncbi:hypothetical protein, partial [Segatella copri]